MSDENTPLEQKAKRVREFWFSKLPEEKRDAIVKPHFEQAHPTNAKIRETAKKYDAEIAEAANEARAEETD